MLVRIYAERGGGPQRAEMAPRLRWSAPPPLISIDLLFPVCAVFLVVPPDVASVVRLHFGALSPARRAPEVRLALFLLHQTHSDLACLELVCFPT